MAVVWCRELPRERSQSGKYQESYQYTRSFMVRVDDPSTPLPDITNAPGFAWRDPHPDDSSCRAMEFDTKCQDESGLIYRVDVVYYVPPVDGGDPADPEGSGFMRSMIWTGSSSAKTIPAVEYDGSTNGAIICNSAGDAIEGLEMETIEPRLSLKMYYPDHNALMAAYHLYTNTVNDATWNGGAAETWRCLGCSFQPISENVAGVSYTFWEVNWEFAYDATTWRLKPWDLGFAERCDAAGTPSSTGSERKLILGQDKKPVRQPVALAGGVALGPGSPPLVINGGDGVEVYEKKAFADEFGEIFTPPVVT